MRPVNKGPNNAGYTPPLTFTFQKNSIAARTLGTQNPTVIACLQQWFNTAWMVTQKKRPRDYDDQVKTQKAISGKVEAVYKTAGVPLVQMIGSYCSYCETPVPGLLEVEHILPKAVYPEFSTDWSNFLLCCSACNVAKSNKPSRQVVAGLLTPPVIYTATAPTQLQCQTYIRDVAYIWPDADAESYRFLPPDLYWYDTDDDEWNVIPADINNSANLNNTIVSIDISTRTVMADVYESGTLYKNLKVAVLITNEADPEIGESTIKLTDLDGLSPTEESTYDRRMINRTQAWFTVLQQMRILQTITSQAAFDAVWPFIPMSAVGTGFYSVWVRLLNTMVDPSGVNLATRFIADTNLPNMYPNTVVTNMP
jgi:5-methylcytosine-specific restriction endonuclease McrA